MDNISPLVPIGWTGGIFLKRIPIFYSALLLTGVNLLLRLVSTGFQVYISGRIGAAGVGLLQLVLSVGGLALTVGMAGIRTASMYLTAGELGRKRPESVRWVLSGCFTYSLLLGGGTAVLLYAFAPAIAAGWIGDGQVQAALRLLAAFLPVNCLCGVMVGYFTAAGRIGTLAVVEILEQLCAMAVTAGTLVLWAGETPARACSSVVLGSGAGTCLTLICLVALRLREHGPQGRRISVCRPLLQTAVPLALSDTVKAGINTTENLMVPRRLSLYTAAGDPMAAFGTVCGMVFPVLMFPAAILYGLAELLIPELARCHAAGSQERIGYLVRRSLRVTLLYGCAFGALMYVWAPDLCLWLYPETEAAPVLRQYAFLIPMLYCDAITDAMTKGLGQQVACVRYNILTSFLDVVFLFLLLPRYGMAGYFFSFLLTHLLNFILSLRRLLKISRQRISLSRPVLSLLSAGVAAWGACHLSGLILRGAACLLLLGCLLFLSGVLKKEDLVWLRSLLTPGGKSNR